MAARLPLKAQEVCQLVQLGVAADNLKFRNVSVESEKAITIRDEVTSEIKVIDLATKMTTKLPNPNNALDGAIMHPTSKVIGLRAGNKLLIRNLEMQSDMKKVSMQGSVLFWRWLNNNTIALVTDTAVYHWSMNGDAQPEKMFDRSAYDGKVQFVSYRASADGKYLLLSGISASPAGGIAGVLQLYSVDMKKSQPLLDAPAAAFANITVDGRDAPSTLFCFTLKNPQGPGYRLNIHELGVDKEIALRRSEELPMADGDFVVSLLPDNKHGMLFLFTKMGFLYIYEIQSGKCIFQRQVTPTTFFISGSHNESGGVVAADTNGRVVHFCIDEENVVPYVTNSLNDAELGVKLATRFNLPGAGDIFKRQFDSLMQQGNIAGAVKLAAESPQGILRTSETIQRLQSAPTLPGQKTPLLQYFSLLLQSGKLNKLESIELVRPLIASGAPSAVEKVEEFVKQDKLDCSEELGDLLRNSNLKLACSIYYRSQCPAKTVGCFLQLGQFDKIIPYAKSVGFVPDYPVLVQQLHRFNPEQARGFAVLLVQNESGPLIDVRTVLDIFMQINDIASTTGFLLEYLKARGDREEDAALQTRLLETNLLGAPHVAKAILESNQFHHFDRHRIARLCENAQIYQYALENYTEMDDIRRVIVNTHAIDPEFLLNFLGNLSPDSCLECLNDLLKFNLAQNLAIVVDAAKRYSDVLKASALIALFEKYNCWQGLFYYLGAFVNSTDDKDVVFKYIEAAVKLNQVPEVERVCRDNNYYDAKQVKDFLLKINLKDPRPLIHVCDRFDMVDELTRHIYGQGQNRVLEVYCQKMNPAATPQVVGSLLDLNCAEDFIMTLIMTVPPPHADASLPQGPHCPIGKLVEQVEHRNRLNMLRNWLEARMAEGNKDPELHNALAKIYVDTNFNAQYFLQNNQFYDSKVVGKYCETRDPHLAFVAYKRANGACDDELINITNLHGFFKDQARYLVERQDSELWNKVLAEDNMYRRQLIDQVIATGLPESRNAEDVVCAVQAFMRAQLPNELIELLEKIVLHSPKDRGFHNVKNLQNLLILTAIKADKKRVMSYITRLENFDGPQIAEIALQDEYALYEEAFVIYNKFQKGVEALDVLLHKLKNIQRAMDYADTLNQPAVWSLLAKAQLTENMVKEAIASFIKAQDASEWESLIRAATEAEAFAELISFLKMAREKVREPAIDNELIVCFAKTDQLSALEDFITRPNCIAKIEDAGDRCYELGAFQAARILFQNCNNQNKLALAWVQLKKFAEAVEAARKANSLPTWKAVCFACVDAKEFRLAAVCGCNIIVINAHLHEVIRHYEVQGYFDEVIALLEQGINLDRAHQGIFTELGVLYAKYKEDKLMEHIKLFWSKLNIPTLLATCREHLHWPEVVFLYSHYDQFDNAVDVLVEHSSVCWTHELFKEIISKATTEKYYQGVNFYLQEHPLLLNELLIELSGKLDHGRVVLMIRDYGHLPLIQKYLLFVQRDNLTLVNEAVNQLYLEEENHTALRESIDLHDQFDQLALAKQLERHELMAFRRISAYLYKTNKRYGQSIELSKKDGMWQDSMECAAESKDSALAEELLRFFVDQGLRECFSACLYICYELIRPDVTMELSWRFGLMNFAMPFMIQFMRDTSNKISDLHNKLAAKDKQEADAKAAEAKAHEEAVATGSHVMPPMMPMMGGPAPLMLPAPPGMGMGGAPLALMPPPGYGAAPMMGAPMMGAPMGMPFGAPAPSNYF